MTFLLKKKKNDQGGEGGLPLKTIEKNMSRADSNLALYTSQPFP